MGIKPVGLFDGDATKGALHKQELEKRAKDEGWVLNPQWANPGAQDFIEPDDQQQDDMIDLVDQLKSDMDKTYAGSQVKKLL